MGGIKWAEHLRTVKHRQYLRAGPKSAAPGENPVYRIIGDTRQSIYWEDIDGNTVDPQNILTQDNFKFECVGSVSPVEHELRDFLEKDGKEKRACSRTVLAIL